MAWFETTLRFCVATKMWRRYFCDGTKRRPANLKSEASDISDRLYFGSVRTPIRLIAEVNSRSEDWNPLRRKAVNRGH